MFDCQKHGQTSGTECQWCKQDHIAEQKARHKRSDSVYAESPQRDADLRFWHGNNRPTSYYHSDSAHKGGSSEPRSKVKNITASRFVEGLEGFVVLVVVLVAIAGASWLLLKHATDLKEWFLNE